MLAFQQLNCAINAEAHVKSHEILSVPAKSTNKFEVTFFVAVRNQSYLTYLSDG